MDGKDKIFSLDKELVCLSGNLNEAKEKVAGNAAIVEENKILIDSIKKELLAMQCAPFPINDYQVNAVEESLKNLDNTIDDLSGIKLKGGIKLTVLDILVGIIAGIIASIIDIIFVGTPEIVKIYKGGEQFDGSILTDMLRKIGNGNNKLSEMFKWLSEKCKVPYDISAEKGVVDPNNHRLRSFGHDPLIGLLFAIVDIILGTATVVDNKGRLKVIINSRKYPVSEKYFAVVYYLGHLLSDVCTARGLPIPGFVMTQFFAGDDNSIAKIAERMYRDGYDLRHFASMETPVLIKNIITDAYYRIFVFEDTRFVESIAEKQIHENRRRAYKYKLRLVSDAVCCGGNVLKFFIPPTMGNMTALNIPEWISLIQDTIINMKYQMREKNVEIIIANREIINDNWYKLLKE